VAIRVVHFADLHLGVENYGRVNPQTGLSTRLEDFLRAFDRVVDHAIENEVDLVVFAGDAFKNRTPTPTHQREFARRIRRLAEHMPVFLLVGNHDLPNTWGRAHALEIYATLRLPNVYVAQTVELYRIQTKRGPVQVLALPWITQSMFLRQEKMRAVSLEEAQLFLLERLHTLIADRLNQADPGVPLILAAHATVEGAVFGSERSVMLGQDLTLPPHMLRHRHITYTALGHIHKHQQVIADPPAVYSGSLERIDFGEEKEEKGFVDVTLHRQKGGSWAAQWTFHPLPVRRFITVQVEARGEEATEVVLNALKTHPIADAVVRLIIRTDASSEPFLDNRRIREALAPAFHVAAIHRDVERPTRWRLTDQESSALLEPRELLRRYFVSLGRSQEEIDVLLRYAEALMDER